MTIFKRTLFDEKILLNKVHFIQRDSEVEANNSPLTNNTINEKNEEKRLKTNLNFCFPSEIKNKNKFKFFEEENKFDTDNQMREKLKKPNPNNLEAFIDKNKINANVNNKRILFAKSKFAENENNENKIDQANSDLLFEELENNCRKSMQSESCIKDLKNEFIDCNKIFDEKNENEIFNKNLINAENNFANKSNIYINKLYKQIKMNFTDYANSEANPNLQEREIKIFSLENNFISKTYNSQYFINKNPEKYFNSQPRDIFHKQKENEANHKNGFNHSINSQDKNSFLGKGHFIHSKNYNIKKSNNININNNISKNLIYKNGNHNHNNNKNNKNADLDNETIDFEISLDDPEPKDSTTNTFNSTTISNGSLKQLEKEYENKNFFAVSENRAKDNSCCICNIALFESNKDESKIIFTLPCKHSFHKDCFVRWYNVKKICPLCRLNLNIEFDFPIKNNKLNYFETNSDMGNLENINSNFKINKDLKMIEDLKILIQN